MTQRTWACAALQGEADPARAQSATDWGSASIRVTSEGMIVIVWEFRVQPGQAAGFERAYAPEGDWARLFRRSPAYRGTELLRDRLIARKNLDDMTYEAALTKLIADQGWG